jgi:hypothetical protein
MKKFGQLVSLILTLYVAATGNLYAQAAAAATTPAAGGATGAAPAGGTAAGGAAGGGAAGPAACTGIDCLPPILSNTTGILQAVANIPKYLQQMVAFSLNFTAKDDSAATSQMQVNFNSLGKNINQNFTTQLGMQQQLVAAVVNKPVSAFMPGGNSPTPAVLGPLPNINDLSYSSLLGYPPVTKGAPAYNPINFINYAGGAGLVHTLPPVTGVGTNASTLVSNYQSYFNTVVAVETFNSFVLSSIYADSANGTNNTTNVQNALVAQASNANWIANIASEELGKVLRQILVFESQSYVLLTQLVQTQKQLLTATVMTNTLLIASNRTNECIMAAKAQGIAPNC